MLACFFWLLFLLLQLFEFAEVSIFCSYSFAEYCLIWEVSECTYDYSGLEPLLIPVCSSLYAQEPIEVDRVSLADRTTC